MKQGQRLNWKFTTGDVDFIVGLAKAGRTAEEIRDRMNSTISRKRVPVEAYEVHSICWQSGVKVRASDSA